MSGTAPNVNAEALPAPPNQTALLAAAVVAVAVDNQGVPTASYGVTVQALVTQVSESTGLIAGTLPVLSTAAVLIPGLPEIASAGGCALVYGQIIARAVATGALSCWQVFLLATRAPNSSSCETVGDVTPSIFYQDSSLTSLTVTLGANNAGPIISVTGLAGGQVDFVYNLNTVSGS